MKSNWLGWLFSVLYFLLTTLILRLFRRLAPPKSRLADWSYDNQQVPEPLPTGAIGGAMWALGIGVALTFFLLRAANQYWAHLDGPSVLTLYATPWLWCFFPLFGALGIPWPVTVWWLRQVGRKDEADGIADAADLKGGMDSFLAMKWLNIGVVAPIAFFTVLAIPIHLSFGDAEVSLGRYGAWHTERFSYSDARRATLIDGYRPGNGGFRPAKDIVIDFVDGRRLSGNAIGDGGTDVREDVVRLLLAKTGLHPDHARTINDIPSR